MKFGRAQVQKFGTEQGAYSFVTDRENFDSQITLTDHEAEIVISYFGMRNIHVGNVQSNKELSLKEFLLFPSEERVSLNLVYPKPDKTELRLYISSSKGFKPDAGDIWFVFVKADKIFIGSMKELEWRSESSILNKDDFDYNYQEIINGTDSIRLQKLREKDVFGRDRNIALERMRIANYECEYDNSHKLFISRYSGKSYLEAHHIIPIALQNNYTISLDKIDNVCCLCPHCHRAVHHAAKNQTRKILNKLTSSRPTLEVYSLNIEDLYSLYAVEEIQ